MTHADGYDLVATSLTEAKIATTPEQRAAAERVVLQRVSDPVAALEVLQALGLR